MLTLREIFNHYIEYRQSGGKVITKDSYQPLKSIIYFIEKKHNTQYLTQALFNEWKQEKSRSYSVMTVVRAFLIYARNNDYIKIRCAKPKYLRAPHKLSVLERPLEKSIISDMLQEFIDWRKSTHPLNVGYHYKLIEFNNYCNSCWPDASKLTNEIVDAWCAIKDTESAITRNGRVSPLSHFIAYARSKGWNDINIPNPLPVRVKTSERKHVFTNNELKEFFFQCDNLHRYATEPEVHFRTRSIVIPVFFRMLYSTGMREHELLALKMSDVNIQKGIITVKSHNRQSKHKVVLSESMRLLVEKYDSAMNKLIKDRQPFFPNPHGDFMSSACITKNFSKIWKKISTEHAEIGSFRVTYAVKNIRKWDNEETGWNIELIYLSRSMGHKNIKATEKYLSLVPRFSKTLSKLSGQNLKDKLPNLKYFDSNEEEY